jgi:PPIC-type PPIASE domain
MRWVRSPSVHFLLIGALLFVVRDLLPDRYGQHTGGLERAPIVISAEQLRQLRADFVRQWGVEPTSGQWQALLQQVVDDQVLYREARRLALDLDDRSIRNRLIQKMRAVSTDPRLGEAELYREALSLGLEDDLVIRRLLRSKMRILLQQDPNGFQFREQDVADYVERHRERFLEPATVSFSHVFLSGRARGEGLQKHAKALLAELRSRSLQPAAAAALSDPFPLGQRLQARTHKGIARFLGASLAEELFGLKPGAWSGPIASSYGLHLVWVHEKVPKKMPPLKSVWKQAVLALQEERAAANLALGLRRLQELYDIRIEGTDSELAQGALNKGGGS